MSSNVVILPTFTKDFIDVDTINILGVSLSYAKKSIVLMSDYNSLVLIPNFIIDNHNEIVNNWGSSLYDISVVRVEGTTQLAFSVNNKLSNKKSLYHKGCIFPLNYGIHIAPNSPVVI